MGHICSVSWHLGYDDAITKTVSCDLIGMKPRHEFFGS